ncbi:hypothetical protein [Psychrobacter sp. ASPA161_6]|uniref:hypothetical protein n=1 Tax=Psychrobacter sp. ASPA161_6 TaxID=3160962 RepID=UPI003F7FD687
MSDELKALIEAARSVRRSLYEHKESEDCGEIYYADAMSGSIEGLVSALNNYQITKACSEVSE